MRQHRVVWALIAVLVASAALVSAKPPLVRARAEERPRALAGWQALRHREQRPYGAESVWNQRVPEHPLLAPESGAIIALQFNDEGAQHVQVRSQEAGAFDYGHPVYFASRSDPTVRIHCTTYCDEQDNGGLPATIHVPAHARPAGGEDSHMAVIQPDMKEIDFGGVRKPAADWGRGGETTITAGAVQNCGSFVSGSGFTAHGAVTVAGACLAAGLLRADELASGRIRHALFLIVNCAAPASRNAYPVENGAATDVCRDRSAPAPPLGARLWLDTPDAQIAAMDAPRWEKAILYALHDYGGFVCDDISGGDHIAGVSFEPEGGDAYHAFGVEDPFAQLGWPSRPVLGALARRYIGADPWQPRDIDLARHLHYLNPCVTRRSC